MGILRLALPLVVWLLSAQCAGAWVASGHARIAETAVAALPDSLPAFFRDGGMQVGASAMDPDYYRLRDLPQLRDVESPEHYLDSELLEGAGWPRLRYEYLALLAEKGLDARTVGTLPYAVIEGMQRLAASFARYRLKPSDDWAQARALHAAGILAHYTADLCQPLHTTIDFDGRAGENGSSPRSGIHRKTDSLATAVFREGVPRVDPPQAADDPWAAIREEFAASHGLVDRVYELETGLEPERVSPEAMVFARERIAASIRFTAAMFATAWEVSGSVKLPDWFREHYLGAGPASSPEGGGTAVEPAESSGSPR